MDSTIISFAVPALVVLVVVVVMMSSGKEEKKQKGPRKAYSDSNISAAMGAVRMFALRHQYKVLGPLTLTKGEKSVTLDGVMIGYFGVLGIKAYGYNGQVFGTAADKQWLWSSVDTREKFQSPVEDCALAARLMREALMNAKIRTPDTEAVFVFTDPKVELCIPRGTGAMRVKDLKKYLGKNKFIEDKGQDIDAMAAVLEAFTVQK